MTETATAVTRTIDAREVPLPGTYAIDTSHTQVGFVVRHLMVSKVRGRFTDFSGTVTVGERPEDSSVEVSVELASVDSGDDKRDGHLRSADFFNTDEHPTMTYTSTSVKPRGDTDWIVEGNLTALGVTKPVTLEVSFEGASLDPWGGTRIGFSADGEINRDDFGVSWNQALESGGVVVGKKVTLDIEAEAIKE
ncbi:MAG: YceI family protein [Acidimicrobiales bacterium]